MYFLLLFITAFLLISIFSTNWPIKFYHDTLLKNLARELHTEPKKHGMMFSNVYSEIIANYRGKDIRIRFIENSVDSIKANSGLEIRIKEAAGIVMEFYRINRNKKAWGDFQQFLSGDKLIDSKWSILTTDQDRAKELWERSQLNQLLKTTPQLEQILINQQEIIVQLKHYYSSKLVLNVLQRIISCSFAK